MRPARTGDLASDLGLPLHDTAATLRAMIDGDEIADQLRDRGLGVREAIETAAGVRLRPIVMTMISTVLGGLPLILSGGPGGEARAAIGWVVFGGLGLAALFTLYLTPVAYLALAPLREAAGGGGRAPRT